MAPSTTGPVGIELYKGSKAKWRVGRELGSGACATVHGLEEIDGTTTEYAIKLTALPSKATKKGKSKEEIQASALYFENLIYTNHVQDIQGTFVPKLPPYGKGPPTYGDEEGASHKIRN